MDTPILVTGAAVPRPFKATLQIRLDLPNGA